MRNDFSLDTFDLPLDDDPSPGPTPSEAEEEPEAAATIRAGAPRRIAARKLATVGVLGFLLFAACGFGVKQWLFAPKPDPAPQAVTLIRHPIAVPRYEEKLQFLIPGLSQEGLDILSLTIETRFHDLERFERFRKDQVLFRDTVYQFLTGQRPVKNTLKTWQGIVQTGLMQHVRQRLPHARADLIRIDRFERL